MGRNGLPLIMICLFLLLAGLLSSNILAAPSSGYGTLEFQVVAGKPAVFSDPSLTGGKYRASNAHVSIYQNESDFSFDDHTDKEGQLILWELPVGLNKYEILFFDLNGDPWKGEGSVFIKSDSWEKKFVELKKEILAG